MYLLLLLAKRQALTVKQEMSTR